MLPNAVRRAGGARRRLFSTGTSGPSALPLFSLLESVSKGRVTPDAAAAQLEALSSGFDALDSFAKVDYAREARTGFPEVIYGKSKTAGQVAEILESMHNRPPSEGGVGVVLASRISPAKHEEVKRILEMRGSGAAVLQSLTYYETAQLQAIRRGDSSPKSPELGKVAVLCAGTADLPVAEEAAVVASLCHAEVDRLYDVGVAGIHRLFSKLHIPRNADVVICVAGMDGALPTVVAGLVQCPVIAVPTSIGYGVSTGGMAALGTMLSACAPGLAVVNIDNGLGAAAMAVKILRGYSRRRRT